MTEADEEEIASSLTGDKRLYRSKTWLKRMYEVEKRALADIADICGVTKTTIKRWLDRHGIPRRTVLEELFLGWQYAIHGRYYRCTRCSAPILRWAMFCWSCGQRYPLWEDRPENVSTR